MSDVANCRSQSRRFPGGDIPQGYLNSETQIIRLLISDEMIHAGVRAAIASETDGLTQWDQVCRIYAAMRRLEGRPS